jgi:hypothetical protein
MASHAGSGVARRLLQLVMRRPAVIAIASTTFLIAIASTMFLIAIASTTFLIALGLRFFTQVRFTSVDASVLRRAHPPAR